MNDCDRCDKRFTEWVGNLRQVKGRWLCNDCVKELRHNAIKRAILKFDKTNPDENTTIETKRFTITYLYHLEECFGCNPYKKYRVESKEHHLPLIVQHWVPNPLFSREYGWTFKITIEGYGTNRELKKE